MAKEMIAMILAGGQGSRLYALTQKLAKPAVPFGGKYRIIDFPLSNCVNSDIDTVMTRSTSSSCPATRSASRITLISCASTKRRTPSSRLPLWKCLGAKPRALV